jgi:iron complex transport system substrate-binding protein
MRGLLLAVLAFVFTASAAHAERVVTIGGDVTEIAFALGEGKRIVGNDDTSMYPEAANALPKVGYVRALAAEGILSLKPDLILLAAGAGPPAVLEQLADTKIKIVKIPGGESLQAVSEKVDAVAAALGVPDKAVTLKKSISDRMAKVNAALASVKDETKTMFLLAQGPGGALAAGAHTSANSMIELARGKNVASGFEGYKPLTAESAVALAPDVIIVAEHAVKMLGGLEKLKARPEVAITPAGKNNRIVVMDAQLLLGFGPRTPEAVADLAKALHPAVKISLAETK